MVGGNGLGQLKFNEPFYHLTTAYRAMATMP
jgi:hypothetical protein